jgi:hypothetical protein
MQAIQTKYLPATNFKPSRIKATCAAGSITIAYPHELSGQAVHRAAAEALVDKVWKGKIKDKLLGGSLKDGSSVFVFDNPWSRD